MSSHLEIHPAAENASNERQASAVSIHKQTLSRYMDLDLQTSIILSVSTRETRLRVHDLDSVE